MFFEFSASIWLAPPIHGQYLKQNWKFLAEFTGKFTYAMLHASHQNWLQAEYRVDACGRYRAQPTTMHPIRKRARIA
jgi:hypothetical protein